MEDQKILDLFWARDEQAITETQQKYGSWCEGIAYRVLNNREDAEECASDTFMTAWDNIPPKRPKILSAWLGRISRNLALTRYRSYHAQKRGGGETALVLEELQLCASSAVTPEGALDRAAAAETINRFLAGLKKGQRCVFMRRYWYMDSVAQIAERYDLTEGQVTALLYRLRRQLKAVLAEEGIEV